MKGLSEKILSAVPGRVHLFSLGQAGYIIKNKDGALAGIDLYLSECVERVEHTEGFKRLLPKLLDTKDLMLNVLITTHAHTDHFDVDAVPSLMQNDKTVLFSSLACKEYVAASNIDEKRVRYQVPGDRACIDGFEIDFLPCDHGTSAPDAFGILIRTDGIVIAVTGDTCIRVDRAAEYRKYGQPDVLIGPINGRYGNMDEEEFALLASEVSPKLAIPCHYGMFPLHGGDPGRFFRVMKERYPHQSFRIMAFGEQYSF